MCHHCTDGEATGLFEIAARSARASEGRLSQAAILHAAGLIALAGAVSTAACQAHRLRCLESLVRVSTSFVAEFKPVGLFDEANLHCRHLFRELRSFAEAVFGQEAADADSGRMRERDEMIGKALVNFADASSGNEDALDEMAPAVRRLADEAADVCELQGELTGEVPPDWDPASIAYCYDRLAVSLYDAAERLDSRARRPGAVETG